MPGAPNRPPTSSAPLATALPAEQAARGVLRRLTPSRVALNLEIWKGPISPDLAVPFEKADGSYRAGDFPGAEAALDKLSVRFAEPRWPSLPEPFRRLRVTIPRPQPPQWDPEHALDAGQKQERQQQRAADNQLALLDGSLLWAEQRAIPVEDLRALAEAAHAAQPAGSPEFWEAVDRAWLGLLDRLPLPKGIAAPPAASPSPNEA
jgi:hypothetical protein